MEPTTRDPSTMRPATIRRRPPAEGLSRLRGLAAASALSLLAVAACGDDDGPAAADPALSATETASGGGAAVERVVITILDFSYDVPASVPAGAEVTVRNEDGVGHTVTSDEEGVFDVAVGPGEEATFTAPDQAGEFPFHCIPHPTMTATLVVG
jgi:plastocyanin